MDVQSSSSTSESVMISMYLYSDLPSFQHCLPSKLHVLFFPCLLKHSSLTISLNSSNLELCGQTHYSCNISWCDNEKQCVPLDYISNILGCYEIFQHFSLYNVCNPKICDHIHYMRSSDHQKHFHTFALVST
jgi:hypothetical protein